MTMEEKEWDVSDTAYPKRKRCKGSATDVR